MEDTKNKISDINILNINTNLNKITEDENYGFAIDDKKIVIWDFSD
jgi:hypothetical protein